MTETPADRAARERKAQGLPPKITDPAVLRRVVAILSRPKRPR